MLGTQALLESVRGQRSLIGVPLDLATVAPPFDLRVVWAYPVPGVGPPPTVRGFNSLGVTAPVTLAFAVPTPSPIEPVAAVDRSPTWSDVATPVPQPTLSSVQVSPTVVTVATGG